MKNMIFSISLMTTAMSMSAHAFMLQSPDIETGKPLKNTQVFTECGGKNISPQLSWSDAPEGTKSYAITVYDPDAPTGSGWWHWTMVNIPATFTTLAANAGQTNSKVLPEGAIQGRNDFGYAGFGGACPPEGDKPHRYQFTVWALGVDKLSVDEQSCGASVGFMLNANVLAKAELVPVYGR